MLRKGDALMLTQNITELKESFVHAISPVRIYLFGSYADDTFTEESDYDFYIIVDDSVNDIPAETTRAYKSVRNIKNRPVDILLATASHFASKTNIPSIERTVLQKGVLLYDRNNKALA